MTDEVDPRLATPMLPDELDGAEETASLLTDPEAMAALRESEAEIDAGQAVPFEDYLRDRGPS